MKKLMIAAAIVCAAVVSQAASFQWKVGTAAVNDGNGGTTKTTAGSVYLFNTSDLAQQSLIDAFLANSFDASAAVGVGSLDAGKLNTWADTTNSSTAGTEVGGNVNNYFAIIDGDKIFVSGNQATEVMDGENVTQISFTGYTTPSKSTVDGSKIKFADQGAAWYQKPASSGVPEPTSGLLMLVGLAGLALRRKLA